MLDEEKYNLALAYATRMHEGQRRMGGDDYITHPIAVAELLRARGYTIEYQITALFHDLLEDTEAEEDEILSLGGEEVLSAVRALTKCPGYDTAEYISAIRKNKIAFRVKAMDRLHNLRSAVVAPDSFKSRYIVETVRFYMDFSPEISDAVLTLGKSADSLSDEAREALKTLE